MTTSPSNIPEAAVEAAGRAVFEQQYEPEEWELVVAQTQQRYLDEARLALEAAAPHILADTWDEGSIAGWVESGLPHSWHAENSLRNSNPYRPAK